MATTLNFRPVVNLPQWRANAPALANSAAGSCFAYDKQNGGSRQPYLYWLRNATALDAYDPITDEWLPLASPALAGTFGAGACAVYHSSQGPRGTIAAGGSATSFTLTTALPAAVGVNQLANKGDGTGFGIRVFNKVTGKLEGRTIVGNTAGTTPTVYLDVALSAAPNLGDGYEIPAGRVFMLSAGVLAAGCWKYYDVATNSFSASLATTNLPATISTDSVAIALSEQHTPYNRNPGEGFVNGGATYDAGFPKNCILATGSSSTSVTGSGMPSDLQANEYRNFQVRIVEDTATPTSVGQRSRIASHTGGATGVFTVAAFGVTPSTTCKFVVENDDDKIILRSSAVNTFFTYNINGNTWDTTTFTAGGSAAGAGVCMEQSFGLARDATLNARQSFVYIFRGAASATLDVLDIAGGANGAISAGATYGNAAQTFTTGTCAAYDPWTLNGQLLHLNVNGTQREARFDMKNRILDTGTYMRYPQGAAVVGGKVGFALFIDGSTKLSFKHMMTNSQANLLSKAIQNG